MAYREVWIADGDNSRWETVYVPDPVQPAAVAATPMTSSVPVAATPSYVAGQSTLPAIEERTVDMGEGTRSEYFIRGTDIPVDAPTYFEDYSQGQLTESSTPTLVANNITIYDPERQGEYVYSPTGQYLGFKEAPRDSSFLGGLREIATETAPIWSAALTAGGAAGALGSTVAPSLGQAAQGALGGALIGGGTAAVTGGDVLRGSLLGGASGYVTSLLNAGVNDPALLQAAYDADIAGGMVPEFGTNAAYDSFMQAAMTPAAQAAIEAQIANSSVGGMTPEQILQQGGMITDIASGNAMGPLTAEQLDAGFQEYMAQNGNIPTTGAAGGGISSEITGTTAGATAGTGLTNSQIANLIKAGLGVASAAGAVNAVGSRPTTPLQAPTQGMPTYSPEYYQQLQQYYNAYLPQTPRDVVTPLQQWYNSAYGD